MKIIGFNFTKIHIEKKSDNLKDLKLESPTVDILEVKQLKSSLFEVKEDVFEIKFSYNIKYSPDVATISLAGTLLAMVDPKTAKDLVKQWKDKKLPDEHKILVFNVILKKSNLKAMELEDELNLPLHIPLPSVREFK